VRAAHCLLVVVVVVALVVQRKIQSHTWLQVVVDDAAAASAAAGAGASGTQSSQRAGCQTCHSNLQTMFAARYSWQCFFPVILHAIGKSLQDNCKV